MNDKATIFVNFRMEGFHRWPAAPEHRSYLRHEHRHLFHVQVRLEVDHDDREIEFHDLLDSSRSIFAELLRSLTESRSCETLARALASRISSMHCRPVMVSVSEDGECGAEVRCGF